MDTNWCLACDRHFEGNGLYCSSVCDDDVLYDDVLYHEINDVSPCPVAVAAAAVPYAAIHAWAASIPPSSPPDHPSTPSTSRDSSKSRHAARLPKLMRPHQRPAVPALSITTPRPALPSSSLPTQPQHCIFATRDPSTATASLVSESSLATPASTLPLARLGSLATHLRDWVAPPAVHPRTALTHPSPIHCAYSSYDDGRHLPPLPSKPRPAPRGRALSRS